MPSKKLRPRQAKASKDIAPSAPAPMSTSDTNAPQHIVYAVGETEDWLVNEESSGTGFEITGLFQ